MGQGGVRLHAGGLERSGHGNGEFGRFVDTWGTALRQMKAAFIRKPDQPGLARSAFNLVAAILRTAARTPGGLTRGVVDSL